MGIFGCSDKDRYREMWHDLNARINGYKLHMPNNWQSLSDSYFMYEEGGVIHVVACINESYLQDYKKYVKSDKNKVLLGTTLIATEIPSPKYLIERAINIEIERANKNIKWDIYD